MHRVFFALYTQAKLTMNVGRKGDKLDENF